MAARKRSRKQDATNDAAPKGRRTAKRHRTDEPSSSSRQAAVPSPTRSTGKFYPDDRWNDETDLRTPEDVQSPDDLPVRWLDQFIFFDPSSNNMEPVDHILNEIGSLEAVGYALDLVLDDWDCDSGHGDMEGSVPVKLSAIWTSTIDLGADATGDSPWNLDSDHIWVRTEYAWYILRAPAKAYEPFYVPFYTPRRAVQLIVQFALDYPRHGRPSFENHLVAVADTDPVLGCRWTAQHFRANEPTIRHILSEELEHDNRRLGDRLGRTCLVRSFLGKKSARALEGQRESDDDFVDEDEGQGEDEGEDEAHEQVVAEVVGRLARPFFRHSWTVVRRPNSPEASSPSDADDAAPPFSPPASPTASDIEINIALEYPIHNDPGKFLEAEYAKTKYRAHDIVKVRGAASVRGQPDVWWFGRIAYFFEDSSKKSDSKRYQVHVEWFNRSDMVLGMAGCPEELFALLLCDDISIATIDGPPIFLLQPSYPLTTAPTGLFCTYLHDGASFIHLTKCADRDTLGSCFVCNCQAKKDETRESDDPRPDQHARKILGINYHDYDFVYLRHGTTAVEVEGVSAIAQILGFLKTGLVRVRICQRSGRGVFGQRQLELKTKKQVAADAIVARCRVAVGQPLPETLIQEPDLFFIDAADVDGTDFQSCNECAQQEEQNRRLQQEFDKVPALRMLDPYSGPGGLALGIERGSRCVRSAYAVDLDESTTKTFQANSSAVCFHMDANRFLPSIVTGNKMQSVDGGTHSLQAGVNVAVDVICAGVPCQGHSGLNMHRQSGVGEHNNHQMLTALSLVEILRPRYLCIENVPDIGNWSLKMRRQAEPDMTVSTDKHGGLRLTITILLALGYQVRVGIVQAGSLGTPQRRRRFILLAADARSSLPELPRPTTAFDSTHGLTLKAFPKVKVPWSVQNDDDEDTFRCPLYVPHGPVTVGDAIGDLPPFNWASDANLGDESGSNLREESSIIYTFPCHPRDGCRPTLTHPYATEPQNEYQLRARASGGVPDVENLQHVTAGYTEDVVRNVCSMDRNRNDTADYRALDSRRGNYMVGDPVSSAGRRGFAPGIYYRRLDGRGAFPTLVTHVYPTAKQSQVIHPWQYRLISVREMARGQGFIDTFRFEGSISDMQRQLGNAVPVTLGEAVGRQIRAAMFKDWCESKEQRDLRNRQHSTSPEL